MTAEAVRAPRTFAIVYQADEFDDEVGQLSGDDAAAAGDMAAAGDPRAEGGADGEGGPTVAGHGLEFADGTAVFVWARRGDSRRTFGDFSSAERALALIDRVRPAELVWFEPQAPQYPSDPR